MGVTLTYALDCNWESLCAVPTETLSLDAIARAESPCVAEGRSQRRAVALIGKPKRAAVSASRSQDNARWPHQSFKFLLLNAAPGRSCQCYSGLFVRLPTPAEVKSKENQPALYVDPKREERTSQAALFRPVAGLVVLMEQVLAKVPCEVAPHGVDVVGVVLRVV